MTDATPFQTQIVIRTLAETLWDAITNGDVTEKYYTLNSRVESTWEPGAAYRYIGPGDQPLIEGKVESVEVNTSVAMTFNPLFLPEPVRGAESHVTYSIAPMGDNSLLTLTHAGLDSNNPTTPTITVGWVAVLSSLKSYLETGTALDIPVQA